MECPLYLKQWEPLWREDPRAAKLAWFREARYGLFIHYGLYSLMHTNEWAMLREKIHVKEYEKLKDHFTAHNFDADYIADLAVRSGMRYINMVTCHHESFCLWDSKIEPFNSVNSPCGRDLVREMSEACDKRGLGFFAYYTFMLNWRHPYYVSRDAFMHARPDYDTPEPAYLYREKADFRKYLDYIEAVMDELLSNYKITGIWLDLIAAWYAMGPEYIPIEEIYTNLRRKHPDVLISWKSGATGTEDFASPENRFETAVEKLRERFGDAGAQRAQYAFEKNRPKHNEVCSTVQRGSWGYNPRMENRPPKELYDLLGHAAENNCNLLLNVGPMADGSIHPVHEKTLLAIADMIREKGYPDRGGASKTQAGAAE